MSRARRKNGRDSHYRSCERYRRAPPRGMGNHRAGYRLSTRPGKILRQYPGRYHGTILSGDIGQLISDLWACDDRFLHQIRRFQHYQGNPHLLPRDRSLGRPGRLVASLGVDPDYFFGPGGLDL